MIFNYFLSGRPKSTRIESLLREIRDPLLSFRQQYHLEGGHKKKKKKKRDSQSPQTLCRFPFLRLCQFRSRVSPGGNHDWHLWQQKEKWVDRRRDGPFSCPTLALVHRIQDARRYIMLLCRSTLGGIEAKEEEELGEIRKQLRP